jgi:hypothetical protein
VCAKLPAIVQRLQGLSALGKLSEQRTGAQRSVDTPT